MLRFAEEKCFGPGPKTLSFRLIIVAKFPSLTLPLPLLSLSLTHTHSLSLSLSLSPSHARSCQLPIYLQKQDRARPDINSKAFRVEKFTPIRANGIFIMTLERKVWAVLLFRVVGLNPGRSSHIKYNFSRIV